MSIDAATAERLIRDNASFDFGKFYGTLNSEAGPIGAGMLLPTARYAVYEQETGLFNTHEGPAIILTHECDIDQQNQRPFNELLIVCPIVLLEKFVDEFDNDPSSQGKLRSFLENLGRNMINRVMYLPPLHNGFLPFGGLLYFNQLSHTHINSVAIENENHFLSAYGLQHFDFKITNHLLRPKSAALPFQLVR
jgi:hypothetical protein